MASDEKWYFTKEQLLQSPSRKSGYDVDKELSCRQQAANFIQDMGQRLQVSQLCINTAIVYMHRFYVFHSLASFHRNAIAAAALFLAAKVEEQPRKLEHVIKVAHICLHRENPNLDTKSEVYLEQAQDLVFNENVLLQTLGFDVAIDHPHTHVVRCCHLVRGLVCILSLDVHRFRENITRKNNAVLRVVLMEPNVKESKELMGQVASKDLAQTSYFMASNSLHLTTMCLQYKPTVVACFCIHLACKWSNWEIPRSNEGKDWFWYVDKSVTLELLEQLTGEFLAIFDKCPTKLKRKMMSMNQNNTSGFPQQSIPHDGLQFVSNFEEPRKLSGAEAVKPPEGLFPAQKQSSQLSSDKPTTSSSSTALSSHSHHQKIDYREYREKKERERLEREKQQHHHHPQQQRDGHMNVLSNSHHHSKGGPLPTKGPSGSQSRSSTASVSHKSYQQQPHGPQNLHFQNTKENIDGSSGPNFQLSRDNKDNNYLKHPHSERDNSKDHHGQFSQSTNVQHQNYPHKPDSSYTHRDGSRTSHSGSSNLSQSHHSQTHTSGNQTLLTNPREFVAREGPNAKDSNEIQSQPSKKDMSSSIRDIIGQTLPQVDSHSMTSERKDVRDKNRSNYMYGNMSSNNRAEILKNGREQCGKIFYESNDKKGEDFASRTKERVYKKENEEPVIDAVKVESIAPNKGEKFDESDSAENFVGTGGSGNVNNWKYDFGLNLSNIKNEKKDLSGMSKTDTSLTKTEMAVDKIESMKSDVIATSVELNSSKSQAVHPARGTYDSKYKSHHYPSGNKSSDISQFKNDKPSAQYSSDLAKKFNDRLHEKPRKGEMDRVSHMPEVGPASEISKHHKLNKDIHEKQKVLILGQQHEQQKLKDGSSPSKFSKMKTMSRPCNLDYLKSESGHFSLGSVIDNSSAESDKNEKIAASHKVTVSEDTCKGMTNVNSLHKQQKSHEFGSAGGLTTSLPDSNLMKHAKTCSIFSPDSKIPPQNILSSLEKDSKKNISMSHRSVSNKSSPTSVTGNVKGVVPTSVSISTAVTSSGSTGSLFSPPLPKTQATVARHRTSSSGSEPELIPVLTKIEETPGYENIIREKRMAISSSDKIVEKSVISERSENSSLFDFDLKAASKEKSGDIKTNVGRTDTSHFGATKQSSSVKLPNEIRSDLGAVIYPSNPKPVSVSKPGSTFSLTEPKLSLSNSVSTVNLSGIEKMVDTSISPAKQSNTYGTSSSLKSNLGMNINFNLSVSSGSNTFGSVASGQSVESAEKLLTDQNSSKINPMLVNQELIDVEDVGHSDSKKRSDKKKKKDKHKHKDKDRSERKKEKKKHKEKDKEKIKEKERHRDKERSKEKEKHKEKEIDVVNSEIVNSEAPIKITIPKDKISGGLKIKISKDCLKKEEVDSPKSGTSGELKLKISKDKFSHMSTYKEESRSSSKKRERSPKSSSDLPYAKFMKTSDKKISGSSRSNGTDGSSRNLSSHRHSVSENGSHIDISSLYDFSLDFEENGEGIIKTPDYDFEALNTSEYQQSINTLSDENDGSVKNSQNEFERLDFQVPPDIIESYPGDVDHSDADISRIGSALSPFPAPDSCIKTEYPKIEENKQIPKLSPAADNNSSPLKISRCDIKKGGPLPTSVSVPERVPDDCYILKNYKSILDSHSKECTVQCGKANVEEQEVRAVEECSSTLVERVSKSARKSHSLETENPNYYNKYFKKEGNNRTWLNEKNKSLKVRIEDKQRSEDKSRFHDKFEPPSQRYRNDHSERSRHCREYCADPQYYFDRGESRRFDYQKYVPNHFFSLNKTDNEAVSLNYDVNANENAGVYQHSKGNPSYVPDSSINNNALDVNMQYHYGYYNSYMYNNGAYRFYGNVPFVNMSLINQQPTPPGTVDTSVQLGPPPLPLEPPPDLPPPPETPPPKQM